MKQESSSKQKLLATAMEMIWQSSYGSVSVDDICTQAGVNKGSFYYAFKSKSDLAVAAFEHYWENKRPLLDSIFSAQITPLEQLNTYCELIIKDQKAKYESFGKMLGCPFCSLGSELSTQDEKIRQKAEQMGLRAIKYLESMVNWRRKFTRTWPAFFFRPRLRIASSMSNGFSTASCACWA
jgi:TetR/AcrR family transcriptional repressor of nem operon